MMCRNISSEQKIAYSFQIVRMAAVSLTHNLGTAL